MSDVGTNGDSLHCHVRCSYSELDAAYRRGKRDGTRGKSRGDNPYPKPPVSKSRSHYQDGRSAFSPVAFERMERFIDHFTEIPVGDFKAALPRMRKDGPGFIEDFGAFCSGAELPEIENHPNMWNTISTVCDMTSGKPISERQAAAALHGTSDPQLKKFCDWFRI
jgi:hypothetical protein